MATLDKKKQHMSEICPKCFGEGIILIKKGTKSKKCKLCNGDGFISEELYNVIRDNNFNTIK